MGAERWIVFLVLASLGGGIYIMSYLVDEESMERYGKRVAEYNAQHHETMMDAALHRAKRGPDVSVNVQPDESEDKRDEIVDHPYSENDRVMRSRVGEDLDSERDKRSNEQGGEGQPRQNGTDRPRARRSSGQGINEDHEISRARRSNEAVLELRKTARTSGPSTDTDSTLGTRIKHENPSLTVVLVQSSEVNDAQEKQTWSDFGVPADSYEPGHNLESSNRQWKLEYSSEESQEEPHSESEENHINPYETFIAIDSGKPDSPARLSRHLLKSDGDKRLITFNKGIDFILGLMNAMFSVEGELSVPLPSLNKTFGHGIMKGTFEAGQGFFKNPATLHRTGDVDIVKNGDSVALEVALGLATVDAGYDHYDLRILKIHQNGTLDVSVAENSIKMKISLTYYPHCKVDVNYLELDKLAGIKVNITGLGAFQSMFDMLSKWLLDNFTNDVRNIVNKKLIEKAKKAVARQDICKYFPLDLL